MLLHWVQVCFQRTIFYVSIDFDFSSVYFALKELQFLYFNDKFAVVVVDLFGVV